MSYTSSRTQGKTTYTSKYGPGANTTKETTTTTSTSSKINQPTKYSETIVRIGRPGSKNAQEIITRKYQQPTRVEETTTKYDPKTGAHQKITTVGYKPETMVVTETRRRGGNQPTTTTTTTTTSSKYQPSSNVIVSEPRSRYAPLSKSVKETTTTTSISNKYQPQTKITETRRRYGPVTSSTKETTTTTTTISGPGTQKRYSVYTPDEEGFVTVPIKVSEKTTAYGPDKKSSKEVTYTTYQKTRAKPITDNYEEKDNKVFVVSEKRTEKYSNDNGKEKKYVTIEKKVADGPKTTGYRRFYASK